MKKLTLNLDALTVESFDTAELQADARGTVQANLMTNDCVTISCGDSVVRACMD